MTEFGKRLRICRKKGGLTQEKLGGLIGEALGDHGFSGAAVSDWERGASKIHADNRIVLVSLLRVLYQHGSIQTLEEADELLEAGNYRALDPEEQQRIFSYQAASHGRNGEKAPIPVMWIWLFNVSIEDWQTLVRKAQPGPEPAWPRILVAFLRQRLDRLHATHVLRALLWLWIGLAAWILLIPSWRWPFEDRGSAQLALVAYAVGTLILPACIAALVNTRDNPFWQEHGLANSWVTRLYVHQGASIGFQVGYFGAFVLGLFRYNLGLPFSNLANLLVLAFPLLLSYASAHLVPHNLFTAYKRLRLSDGAIFFVFPLAGPGWGYFLFEYYPILLRHNLGLTLFLASATLLAAVTILRKRNSKEQDTVF
ncbi:MAG: helix-turn-helix transcriptional regulator [Chloroflexi bacterium]|nr:helix-turn-helix transcriptional regulator [Chloroflexota bacterium]